MFAQLLAPLALAFAGTSTVAQTPVLTDLLAPGAPSISGDLIA
jgi:hypothetical protein